MTIPKAIPKEGSRDPAQDRVPPRSPSSARSRGHVGDLNALLSDGIAPAAAQA